MYAIPLQFKEQGSRWAITPHPTRMKRAAITEKRGCQVGMGSLRHLQRTEWPPSFSNTVEWLRHLWVYWGYCCHSVTQHVSRLSRYQWWGRARVENSNTNSRKDCTDQGLDPEVGKRLEERVSPVEQHLKHNDQKGASSLNWRLFSFFELHTIIGLQDIESKLIKSQS